MRPLSGRLLPWKTPSAQTDLACFSQSELCDEMRPRGQKHFEVAIGPHADMKRTVRLVMILDQCDRVSREATRRSDDQDINAWRLPKLHLAAYIADVPRADTARQPVFALDDDTMTPHPAQRIVIDPRHR